jgi:hypothetical protein
LSEEVRANSRCIFDGSRTSYRFDSFLADWRPAARACVLVAIVGGLHCRWLASWLLVEGERHLEVRKNSRYFEIVEERAFLPTGDLLPIIKYSTSTLGMRGGHR